MTSTLLREPPAPTAAPPDGATFRLVRSAARVAQRRPRTIIAMWLLLVVACFAAGTIAGNRSLTDVQSEVGDSAKADRLVEHAGLADPAAENILVTSPSRATTAVVAAQLTRRLSALPEVGSVRGPARVSGLATDGGRVALVQADLRGDPGDAADHVTPVEVAVATVAHEHPGVRLQQAGLGSENKVINDLIDHDIHWAEQISLPITLLILVLAFGALVAASVPLLLGLTSVAAAMGALGVVSHLAPDSDSTSAVVVLIGLAVGVDYSLFYLRREREERRRGRPDGRSRAEAGAESALDAAAASVGRAILVSGLTVVVALAGLLVTGAGDFISMGLGTILVVLIAVVGSLTVLPAVLALLGDRVDRGRVPGYRRMRARRARREEAAGQRRGFWARLARAATALPGLTLVTAICLLGTLAVPLLGMNTASLNESDLPKNLPVVASGRAIDAAFPGAPDSTDLVVTGSQLDSKAARKGLAALGHRALATTGGRGDIGVKVSRDGQVAKVDVPMPDRGVATADTIVKRLRADVAPAATGVRGVHGPALVTGSSASDLDYSDRMRSATPEVIGFVLALGFLLLLATFRAPLLAAAVMALNLASIGAAYGVLTAVFQHHWAEGLLGFTSNGHIIDWLPLFMFVVLFGLSMDYTVLVLERVREARLAGLRPREAAAEGVAATAGAVTSAAIVMVAVFAIFATMDVISFKELGVGLAAAVFLDATLVRGVALPATIALLGERGWPERALRSRRPRRAARKAKDAAHAGDAADAANFGDGGSVPAGGAGWDDRHVPVHDVAESRR